MNRREFLQVVAAAAAAGLPLDARSALDLSAGASFYDSIERFGSVSLLHFTDCHAQLRPIFFREPNVNLGVGGALGNPPHIVGDALLRHFGIRPGTREAHAFTYLDFERAAKAYGAVGGFAHLATLVRKLRASRPGALLLDGGDTWQGSATALWTKGQDMVDACKLLGVDVMTGHWEFTLGADRVKEIVERDFAGKVDFVAQNVKTADFGDPVFKPYVIRPVNGVPVAVIGQAFPYTPIANPRYFVPEWTFGIQEQELQKAVDEARGKGAQVAVLLSHNGMDVDLKLASRVTGLDAILGGHTHDGVPQPTIVANRGGRTIVTNAGSNGKFLAVLDFDVRGGKVADFRYRLVPVFAALLPPDREMAALIEKIRAPYASKLEEPLAITETLLYRRGSFNGTFDQLLLDALMAEKNAPIAFSPGFRWGTTLLPGQPVRREHLMDQTAITYPFVTVNEIKGAMIRTILEDVADNLFNPDPYYQQGGDMVRVGGLKYAIDPNAKAGSRITRMELAGKPVDADKSYKVAGWAPVSEEAKAAGGEPIWDVIERHLVHQRTIRARTLDLPELVGMRGNPGIA
ncbi:sulfur-oxidizing protein SoxB [Burkholderiales bacterium]|nr:sulfur-oxidizing protein SoxB [Burkholderiales bacterium]